MDAQAVSPQPAAPNLYFAVLGLPVSQGSKTREFNPHTGKAWIRDANPHKLNYWRRDISNACQEAMQQAELGLLRGGVRLGLIFHYARPITHFSKRNGALKPSAPLWKTGRPDLGKLARAVEDALKNAGLYGDDAQVVDYEPKRKVWSDRNGVEVWVWDLSEEAAPLRVVQG